MADILHSILRWSHIVAGFAGLAAFWVPVFARKGARVHRAAGKVFAVCAVIVGVSATVSATWAIAHPASWAGLPDTLQGARLAEVEREIRGFMGFLGMLALATLLGVSQALRALRLRREPDALRAPSHLALAGLCMLAGAAVLLAGIVNRNGLWIGMSAIGLLGGWGSVGTARRPPQGRMGWWYEHMGNMLGAGIAFHTAFLVFGAGRLFGITPNEQAGVLTYLPWILPAAIGLPAIAIWTRHYRRKFGDDPAAPRPASAG